MIGLTPAQRSALLVIQELTAAFGYGPTFSEIADELGVRSKASVHNLIRALVERGAISIRPGQWRSITVLRPIPMPEDFPFELTAAGLAAAGAAVA